MRKFIIPFATAVVLAFSCEKAPEEVSVTGVSIDRLSAELVVGETVQLSATITPSDATYQNITWTSSKNNVATVSDNGLVTAIAEGRSIIKANVGKMTSLCVVKVSKEFVATTSVTLDKTSISLTKGQSKTLIATVKPDDATNKTVSWTSSAPGTVSVDSNGKVTAVSGGSATITAKADNQQATCVVTVTVPTESITLNKSEFTLTKGQSETIIATVKPDDAFGDTVSWTSSNTFVANVESDGKVTAVGGGQATITARVGHLTATCILTVTVPAESITLNPSITLDEGESVTLKATLSPNDATEIVTWSSSNESIATVDQDGKVHALKKGSADIVAKAGNHLATCTVKVVKSVISISLDKNNLTLSVGDTFSLTATVSPDDATDKTITWESSDTYVATVENGVVKGIGVGETTITATAGKVSTTCSILVVMDSPNGVSARFYGGDFERIGDLVQPGGKLIFGVRNYSSETIHVVSVQWIDSQTEIASDAVSIDSDIASGETKKWTIPIGDSSIYSPKARFVYKFKGDSYTCEAEIIPL